MSSSGAPAIFNSGPAVKAVITLILIENSQEMVSAWDDLQGHLHTLLGTMRLANPIVPIRVLWLTTTPAGDDSTSLLSAPPRQYNQLPELRFSFNPDNRITSRIVNRAIELMLEAAVPSYGEAVSLHLIVVAASTPIEGTWGVPKMMPAQIGESEWQLLGQKMAQYGIHCHMVLRSSQNMRSMNELFLANLELQGHEQVLPWFLTGPDYTFHLSASRSEPSTMPMMGKETSSTTIRPSVQRHQTFPQDPQRTTPGNPAPLQVGSTPSLVTSLQKVHGLSRKKLYGTQPPRQPFVREEPVRTKYRHAPTPLSIPAGGQTPEDGHAVGKNKVERTRRADRSSYIGGVLDFTFPGRKSPWNCSRLSSPDMGSVPSSPTTSLSSHHGTSPTIPTYPELAGFPVTPPTTSMTFSPDMMSMSDASFSTPMNVCDPSGGYFSVSPSLQTPLSAILPIPSQGPAWTPLTKPVNSPQSSNQEARNRLAPLQNLNAMSNKYRLDTMSNEPRSGNRVSQKVKDAGDVPFIFTPELEAATAAKLKAALQSTSGPSQFSTLTSMNNYTTSDGACASDFLLVPELL
ncbi:hypothetical protein BU15DRAFT_71459 [Melanogaster broomeanus]|nr:hypothetical protein BU15DRAFT_71459 [Melanogaster broomeanus]